MTRLILAAGVAALAITAPAASQPSDRGGKDQRAQVQKERGKARAQRAERRQQATERRSNAREQRAQRVDRSREQRAQRVDRSREQRAQRVDRAREQRVAQVRDDRAQRVDMVRDQRAQRVDRVRDQRLDRPRVAEQRMIARDRQVERIANRPDRQVVRIDQRRERQIDRIANRNDRQLARLAETRVVRVNEWDDLIRGGIWLNGCPPGLAKKPVACVPPGQVNNVIGQPLSVLGDRVVLQDLPNRLRFAYVDTPDYYYRYGNGYMYQVNRNDNLIMSLLPLFGLGLTVGQPFPTAYSNYFLPTGLQPFYANSSCGYSPYGNNFLYGNNDYYRYANGYVYEVDCRTGLIEDVDPLLGYGYGYGQMMPFTYSAYNVPYAYRPFYQDTSDYYYRYAPGAIYQVDPTTSLVTAVAALLTGGMTVGQPLPVGYSAYNVPYAYRTTYYDTPNAHYRYANGYIYRVDPSTMLVTALVASALT